jgi:restriction system protein
MRQRKSAFDDVMEFAGRLPWGVGVALAAAVYIGLHAVTGVKPATPTKLGQFGAYVNWRFIITIAGFLQYLLPVGLLIGALGSFIRRRRGRMLLSGAAADSVGAIDAMSWQDFERVVGASFERQGYTVTYTGGGGADGGVDLVLTKGRERTLVQCKQWRAWKVSVTTVRELFGVMAAKGAAHGIVVTAGEFTADAREFASGRNIGLLNGRELAEILRDPANAKTTGAASNNPSCPNCGSRMVERVARKGSRAGQAFWGCETFPACRATVPIAAWAARRKEGSQEPFLGE